MKISALIIHNIGLVADSRIEFNKPLIVLYGEIRNGKTTHLNAVRWVCGGKFPDDILRHGEKEGHIELEFDGGSIRREFYRAKDETTKARAVQFIRSGKPVKDAVLELKRMLNPFLMDQDFLRAKSELERKQYFTELFAVDTTALDTELFNAQRDAQALRAKIAGYGEIDLTPVKPVDAFALKVKRSEIQKQLEHDRAVWSTRCAEVDEYYSKKINEHTNLCALIQTHNSKVQKRKEDQAQIFRDIARLKAELSELEKERDENGKWLTDNTVKESPAMPVRPVNPAAPVPSDTSVLDFELQNAVGQNVRAEQFAANQKRAAAKRSDETTLATLEARGRAIKAEKTAKLKGVSDTCGIPGLAFDESGNFIYEGTTAGMISDSQIMKLSDALSAMYPDGFGLSLLDRGESLGKSIFGLIERAQRDETTILATVVGEAPAKVPEHVGVFIVESGKVTAALSPEREAK